MEVGAALELGLRQLRVDCLVRVEVALEETVVQVDVCQVELLEIDGVVVTD